MKTKHSIISTLLAGTLLAMSGSASAAVIWTWNGTFADWQNTAIPATTAATIIDSTPVGQPGTYAGTGDGNLAYTFISQTISANPAVGNHVVISEDQTNGIDSYSLGFDLLGFTLPIGSTFAYSMTTLKPAESLVKIALDSIITAGTNGVVTKSVYGSYDSLTGIFSNLLLPVLVSTDGARNPTSGYYTFAPQSTIYIVDTIVSGSVVNVFNETQIPVPATLALFGIGLLGLFGFSRKSENSSGMKYC